LDAIKALYTTTDGRISRKQWWLGVVGLIVASIVLSIILAIIGLGTNSAWGQLIAFLILLYPNYCLSIKRRHDRDNNGNDVKGFLGISALLTVAQAFGIGMTMTDIGNGVMLPMPDMPMSIVLFLLGLFGLYLFIQLGFLKGTPGSNSYGADPLGYAAA
jgi:uncharacterized membrane protein YhaH (DUF805 family)